MTKQKQSYESVARAYLMKHGYTGTKLDNILDGFDFSKSIYQQWLHQGDVIYQFVRRSSFNTPLPRLGNWFCLRGARLGGLAIISGSEGRPVAKIRIQSPLQALEGIAKAQSINWNWSGGGPGGSTQIFVPDRYLRTHLRILGYATNLTEAAEM